MKAEGNGARKQKQTESTGQKTAPMARRGVFSRKALLGTTICSTIFAAALAANQFYFKYDISAIFSQGEKQGETRVQRPPEKKIYVPASLRG